MAADEIPSSWGDPQYVSTVVGILAIGTLYVYSVLVEGTPAPEAVTFVLLWIFVPMGVSYELARRLQ